MTKIELFNDTIKIYNLPKEFISSVVQKCSWTNKSVAYQLKKMKNNTYSLIHSANKIKELEQKEKGMLLFYNKEEQFLKLPAGFLDYIKEYNLPIEDHTTDSKNKFVYQFKTKVFDPRPYQQEAIDSAIENKRGVIVLGTGMGKSLVSIYITQKLGMKTLIVCPSKAIASQLFIEYQAVFGEDQVGFYGDGIKQIRNITIGIVKSIYNGIDTLKTKGFTLCIMDEGHHSGAETFSGIIKGITSLERVYALSATPYRADGLDVFIEAYCGTNIINRDAKWGIKNGYLTQPQFVVKKIQSLSREIKGDKLKNYKSCILNNRKVKQIIEDDIARNMNKGKSILVIVDQVEHGKELAAKLKVPFATGLDKNSDFYIRQFVNKEIDTLIGVDLKIGEGVDTKPTDILFLVNFAVSEGFVTQLVGRALRLYPNKKIATIVDYMIEDNAMFKRHCALRMKIYKELGPIHFK